MKIGMEYAVFIVAILGGCLFAFEVIVINAGITTESKILLSMCVGTIVTGGLIWFIVYVLEFVGKQTMR